MTEEEYFRKNYPDFCYGDKPLSPYWDLFQDGVEFGERQSEKKIEDLEQKLEQTEKDLADYLFNYPTIKELEKENAEKIEQAEQFIKGENIILEDVQAGNSPFDADEVFNKEMKAYPEGKVK